MSKRVKIIMVAVAVVLALTLALKAVAFASEPDDSEAASEGPWQTYMGKVANQLGIDEEQLQAACNAASQEMRDEAIERFLERAVEEGCIDEQESAEILEWWNDRPAAVDGLAECMRPQMGIKSRVQHRLISPGPWQGLGFCK